MTKSTDQRGSTLWLAAGTGLVGVSLGAAAVMLGLRAGPAQTRDIERAPSAPAVQPAARPTVEPLAPPAPTLIDAVARTRDAVVNLRAADSLGAGVIVHDSGVIITNHHVIVRAFDEAPGFRSAASNPTVTARFENGRELPATVLVADADEDLAILRLVPAREGETFAAAELGSSTTLAVGQEVFAIGNPFGLNHSVSRGIVSALDRTELMGNRKLPLIQLDASINLGNSGGPLFALDGSLVGIVTLRRQDAEGIAFAVPVDHVRGFLRVVGDGEQPRRSAAIGVLVASEAEALRPDDPGAPPDRHGYARSLRILEVLEGGAAQVAGLQPDDRIVEIRGKRLDGLSPSPPDLGRYLVSTVRSLFPGERLPLTVVRGDEVVEVELEVGTAPLDRQVAIDAEELLGLGLRDGDGVPVVERVQPGGPLGRIGIDPKGMQIVWLFGREIDSRQALGEQLEKIRALALQSPGPFVVWLGVEGASGETAFARVRVP